MIFRREVRDQVRDRRTLFMIFVLPILLYPILGIGIVQFSAAFEQKPRTVVVVGAEYLPDEPPLLNAERDGFDPALFDSPAEAERLVVTARARARGRGSTRTAASRRSATAWPTRSSPIPADLRAAARARSSRETIPIAYDSTDEPSQITYLRLKEVLARWKEHDRRRAG